MRIKRSVRTGVRSYLWRSKMEINKELNDKYRRKYIRVSRKWQRLKFHVKYCPNCYSPNIGLNESHTYKWRRFWLECDDCYTASKSRPTIRMAIRSWNRMKPDKKVNNEQD